MKNGEKKEGKAWLFQVLRLYFLVLMRMKEVRAPINVLKPMNKDERQKKLGDNVSEFFSPQMASKRQQSRGG